MKRYAILISGRGSNMVALLDAQLPGVCAGVISNRPEAGGLALAAARGVPTHVVDHRAHAGREAFDAALAHTVRALDVDLVLLAGFMRILTPAFVAPFADRLLNIHPSLLPAFPGLSTHEQALAAGVRVHGCTVHFVTNALDGGPIAAQAAVPVRADDTPATLSARVLVEEHRLYPRVARWCLEGRLRLVDGRVRLDGEQAREAALHVPDAAA